MRLRLSKVYDDRGGLSTCLLPITKKHQSVRTEPFFKLICWLLAAIVAAGQIQPLLACDQVAAANGVPTISSLTTTEGLLEGGNTTDILGTNFFADGQVKFEQIAAGQFHALAIDSAGELYVWGRNQSGQLGTNMTGMTGVPVNQTTSQQFDGVDNPLYGKTFIAVAAGILHSLAIDSSGQLYAWGNNDRGQLGNNSTTDGHLAINLSATATFDNVPNPLYEKTFQAVAAGYSHSLAIDSVGELYAWGANGSGQLGDNSGVDSFIALNISAIQFGGGVTNALYGRTFRTVSADSYHSFAIDSLGQLYAWGGNSSGQLGNNSTTDALAAINLSVTQFSGGLTNLLYDNTFQMITTGLAHTLAIDSAGRLYAWGDNNRGQLGNNTAVRSLIAVSLTNDQQLNGADNPIYNRTFRSVSAGREHTFAIDGSGQLFAWGSNLGGQLGNNSYAASSYIPINLSATQFDGGALNPLYGLTFQSATAVFNYSYAIDSAGQLYAWGDNFYGQICIDIPGEIRIAVNLSTALIWPTITDKNIKMIAGGESHSLAIASTGELYAWGNNTNGQVGNNSVSIVRTPVNLSNTQFSGGVTNELYEKVFRTIAAGTAHSLAIDSSGQLYTWGYNDYGQLGDNSTTGSRTAINLSAAEFVGGVANPLYGKHIQSIAAGYSHSLAIDSSGQLYAWGLNSSGQLGDNTMVDSHVAVNLSTTQFGDGTTNQLYGKTFQSIIAGYLHSLAIDSSGQVYAWGHNGSGQLGNNTVASSPIAINLSATQFSGAINLLYGQVFRDISAGRDHSLAIDSSGQLYAWGAGSLGQLGNNVLSSSRIAINLSTLQLSGGVTNQLQNQTFRSIVAGYYHNLAISSSGQLYTWGHNNGGQLGDNTTTRSPVAINLSTTQFSGGATNLLYGKTIRTASGGTDCSHVIDGAGDLYGWGYNSSGQVGIVGVGLSSVALLISIPSLGPNILSVSFGGAAATSFKVISDTRITAVVPPGAAAGPVNVVVTDYGRQVARLTDGYTYYTVPDAPTLTALQPGDGAIVLLWDAPSSEGFTSLTGYQIEVSDDRGALWTVAVLDTGTPGVTTNTYNVDDTDTVYSFRVSAINKAGVGAPSNVLSSRSGYIEFGVDNNEVNIRIEPTPLGNISVRKNTASFRTNYANGVELSLYTDSSSDNSLRHEAMSVNFVASVVGTPTQPSQLAANTWGFAIPSGDSSVQTGFDASYDELSSVSTSGSKFAAVPVRGNGFVFEETVSANPEVINDTDIYYGARADSSLPAGVYKTIVVYTIVAK